MTPPSPGHPPRSRAATDAATCRPGCNCEFGIETDNAMRNQARKMLGFEIDDDGLGQARFAHNREGLWLMISGD